MRINDEVVQEATLHEHRRGVIGFQQASSREVTVKFRNLRIKTLSLPSATKAGNPV